MFNFVIDFDQQVKFENWDENHDCEFKKNSGAIGGRLKYSFTPTSLGVITKITCACGESTDLTYYDCW